MTQRPRRPQFFTDPYLFIVSLILFLIGIMMIFSTTGYLTQSRLKVSSFFYLKGHLISLGIGFVAFYVARSIPLEFLRRYAGWILIGTLLVLFAVIAGLGAKVGGATRWLKIGGIRLGQPSEFAKIAIVLYLSDSLARKQDRIKEFLMGFLSPLSVVGFLILLLMMQPDFGTSMMILSVSGILLFLANVPIFYLVGTALFGLPVIYLLVILAPYRLARITSFLDPFAPENIRNGAYQLVQSLKTFASGGIFGAGLGNGTQKLGYLPEAHTDFIFAVLGEELGLIGAIVVMLLLLFLIYRGLRIAMRSNVFFEKLFAVGLTSIIAVQSLLNMGVVMGVLPTKGMPLPFISFARSSIIVVFMVIGFLLQIEARTQERYFRAVEARRRTKNSREKQGGTS